MIYVITAVCFAICIAAIVIALKVHRENREIDPWKRELRDDERDHKLN